MAKIKSPKTAAGVTVTKAHITAAANIIQSNSEEGHPQALLARVLALQEQISGAPVDLTTPGSTEKPA